MTVHAKAHRQNRIAEWVENNAGILISVFFHVLIFSFLLTSVYHPLRQPPQPRRLNLILQPLPPISEEVPAVMMPENVIQPAAATAPEKSEIIKDDQVTISSEASKTEEAAVEQVQMDEHLVIERKKLMADLQNLEKSQNEMRAELEARAIQANVQPGKHRSSGAAKGVVRTLNFKGFSHEVVAGIMNRYDIRIEQKFVGKGKKNSFLSYAETNQGTFVNHEGSGYYEVLVLSRQAMHKMSQLELKELVKRGYDLERTTVVRAEFGIRETNGEYDLGILDFEAQEID